MEQNNQSSAYFSSREWFVGLLHDPHKLFSKVYAPPMPWTFRELACGFILLLYETFTIIWTALYWWTPWIDLKGVVIQTTLLLVFITIPSLFSIKTVKSTILWHGIILFLPTCCCPIILLLFRFGVQDVTLRAEVYESVAFMFFFIVIVLWAAVWKFFVYYSLNRFQLTRSISKLILYVMVPWFIDLGFAAGFIVNFLLYIGI